MLSIYLGSIAISTLAWHTAGAPQANHAATDPGALMNALVSLSGVVSDPNGPFASNGALGANGALGPGCLADNTAALGPDGPFGVNGTFGPNGQFGPDGPFGPNGPFGPRRQVRPFTLPAVCPFSELSQRDGLGLCVCICTTCLATTRRDDETPTPPTLLYCPVINEIIFCLSPRRLMERLL